MYEIYAPEDNDELHIAWARMWSERNSYEETGDNNWQGDSSPELLDAVY